MLAFASLLDASPAAADDGEVVFCLGSQRSRLIDTAVMLGLAARVAGNPGEVHPSGSPAGTHRTLEQWRTESPDGFTNACDALISVVQLEKEGRAPGPGPFGTVVNVLVPAVFGALLTWLIGLQASVFTARQAQAGALRSTAKQFRAEAELLVSTVAAARPGVQKPPDNLWRARADLVTQLDQVTALHRRWREPGRLSEELYEPALWTAITRFAGESAAERAAWSAAALDRLSGLALRVERVARALQQPLRPHAEMRAAAPPGGTHAP